MANGVFLLSSAAVGKRMMMSPLIHAETNSVTNRLMSFCENNAADSSGGFLLILTRMTFLSSALSFVLLSVFFSSEPSLLAVESAMSAVT